MPICIPAAAGKPYRPSNGTEGEMFYEQNCMRCTRETEDEPCVIFGMSMFNDIGDPDYPTEWKYDQDGRPQCTAFSERPESEA